MTEVAGPVVAWRRWRADPRSGILYSIFKARPWPPLERFEARCLRGGLVFKSSSSCAHAPTMNCRCGVWGVTDRGNLDTAARTFTVPAYDLAGRPPIRVDVVGQVALWGRVVETETGWRAQYAYPYDLEVLPPRSSLHSDEAHELARACARRVRENYVVDVS